MQENIIGSVCIIGAGPVGLATALRLSDFNISSIIFDENPSLKREGSKACLIQGDVLEILDKSDCAKRIHSDGVPWTYSNVYIGGTRISRAHYVVENRFAPFVNISQYRIEEILLDEISRRPNIKIEWLSRIEDLHQSPEAVTVAVRRKGLSERLAFPYVVASNGVRSNIRDILGLKWNGYRHRSQFLITDVRAKIPLPKERHFHFDPPFNRGYQVIMHPQPDEVWRIDWQLPANVDVEAEKHNGNLERRIRSVIGDVDYRLDWMSVYRFQQRILERFVEGRVIFAGDSAHALPPYGSRGMNGGIQDADNLAWKLALVINGRADAALLKTYDEERTAAAKENVDITERTIKFMVPSNPAIRLRRQILFGLAKRYPRFRKHVNSGTMAKPHRYVASRIIQAASASALAGMFAPDADIQVGTKKTKLRELLGKGFTFLYVGTEEPKTTPPLNRLRFSLGFIECSAIFLQVGGGHLTSSQPNYRVGTVDDAILEHYPTGKWHLIRPDMHIAGSYQVTVEEDFQMVLQRHSLALGVLEPKSSFHTAQSPTREFAETEKNL